MPDSTPLPYRGHTKGPVQSDQRSTWASPLIPLEANLLPPKSPQAGNEAFISPQPNFHNENR